MILNLKKEEEEEEKTADLLFSMPCSLYGQIGGSARGGKKAMHPFRRNGGAQC